MLCDVCAPKAARVPTPRNAPPGRAAAVTAATAKAKAPAAPTATRTATATRALQATPKQTTNASFPKHQMVDRAPLPPRAPLGRAAAATAATAEVALPAAPTATRTATATLATLRSSTKLRRNAIRDGKTATAVRLPTNAVLKTAVADTAATQKGSLLDAQSATRTATAKRVVLGTPNRTTSALLQLQLQPPPPQQQRPPQHRTATWVRSIAQARAPAPCLKTMHATPNATTRMSVRPRRVCTRHGRRIAACTNVGSHREHRRGSHAL